MAPSSKRPGLPSTLARSPEEAQRTYLETLESAETTYDKAELAEALRKANDRATAEA